ncbi:MAG: hypothetical protein ACKOWZ_05735 [Sediminibacterium sp.]
MKKIWPSVNLGLGFVPWEKVALEAVFDIAIVFSKCVKNTYPLN